MLSQDEIREYFPWLIVSEEDLNLINQWLDEDDFPSAEEAGIMSINGFIREQTRINNERKYHD